MENNRSGNRPITIALLFCSAALLLFVIWLVFVANNLWFDEEIKTFFSSTVTSRNTAFVKAITSLGNHIFLIPANLIVIAFFSFSKNRREAFRVSIIALGSFGLMSLLKNLFQRHRPDNPLVDGITNYSFPSGHAFMSVAFFGLLIYYSLTFLKLKWHQKLITSILLLFIIAIGISRIYLNVHYATDVIAGWIIGSGWLIICLYVTDKLIKRNPTSYS